MPSIFLPPATCTVDLVSIFKLRIVPEVIIFLMISGLVQPVSEAMVNVLPVAVVIVHVSNMPRPLFADFTLLFLYSSSICLLFWSEVCTGGLFVCLFEWLYCFDLCSLSVMVICCWCRCW